MKLKCCPFKVLKNIILERKSRIVLFGTGVLGQISTVEILADLGLLSNIDCYVDNIFICFACSI